MKMKNVRKISGEVIIKDKKILLIQRRYKPHKSTWYPPGEFTEKAINPSQNIRSILDNLLK